MEKIIELKAKLEYHLWENKIEMDFFKLQTANIRYWQRLIKDSSLENYSEDQMLEDKLINPLQKRIENFKQNLLN